MTAHFIWTKTWTGRWSPSLVYGEYEAPRESREPTKVRSLSGEFLTLALSDDPQRMVRLTRAFPPPPDLDPAHEQA
jgi:hypothetical protein